MPNTPNTRNLTEIIIISIAVIMCIAVAPFAIYRYLNGQYMAAITEVVSLGIMACIGYYVYRNGSTNRINFGTSVFMLTGLVSFNYIMGTSILFWTYPIILTVYFLNSIKVSAALVTLAMFALLPLLLLEKPLIEVNSIMVTLVICQLFGYLLSKTIRQQYQQLQELANRDGLTGALNRRAFDERVTLLHKTSGINEVEIVASLIIFDIDNFKQMNDQFGHQEGDEILIRLTRLVRNNIREEDRLYRYGGEEFVIIVKCATARKASEIAEKIRQKIEDSHISAQTVVTASFGVAEFRKEESPSNWIDRADKALYRAKAEGKNRVFLDFKKSNDRRLSVVQ